MLGQYSNVEQFLNTLSTTGPHTVKAVIKGNNLAI